MSGPAKSTRPIAHDAQVRAPVRRTLRRNERILQRSDRPTIGPRKIKTSTRTSRIKLVCSVENCSSRGGNGRPILKVEVYLSLQHLRRLSNVRPARGQIYPVPGVCYDDSRDSSGREHDCSRGEALRREGVGELPHLWGPVSRLLREYQIALLRSPLPSRRLTDFEQ